MIGHTCCKLGPCQERQSLDLWYRMPQPSPSCYSIDPGSQGNSWLCPWYPADADLTTCSSDLKNFCIYFKFFFFWTTQHEGSYFPDQGLNSYAPAAEGQILNHWTAREVPSGSTFNQHLGLFTRSFLDWEFVICASLGSHYMGMGAECGCKNGNKLDISGSLAVSPVQTGRLVRLGLAYFSPLWVWGWPQGPGLLGCCSGCWKLLSQAKFEAQL